LARVTRFAERSSYRFIDLTARLAELADWAVTAPVVAWAAAV
jgi:hypothetical protein